MSKQRFEGKSVEAALAAAAEQFGVEVSELEHEVVEEKTDDFWGLGEKVFVVEAWLEGEDEEPEPEVEEPEPAAKPEPPAPAAEPSPMAEAATTDASDPVAPPVERDQKAEEGGGAERPKPESAAGAADVREIEPGVVAAKPEDVDSGEPTVLATQEELEDDDLPEAAVALLAKIFDAMDFECEAQARMEDDTLLVAVNGDDNQFLLDGRGRGLSALELILNHAFRHRTDGGRKKVRVDAGDFRSRRDDEIRDMAYQVAHQAKESGEAQQTRPLNPYERRIVHLTLAEDSQLKTRSEGTGFMKAVNIIPTQSGGRDRGSRRRR